MHSLEDPSDVLNHDAFDLIDHAASLSYHVLALTLHGKQHCPSELREYAESKGILLIPGIEAYVENREFLLLGAEESTVKRFKSLSDVQSYKKEKEDDILVIAPHPFYGLSQCIGDKIEQHPELFDALEYCHFYTDWWNPNRTAEQLANKLGKPMLACSDTHRLDWMKDHYFLVDSEKDQRAIFRAIRQRSVRNVTRPLKNFEFAAHVWWHACVHTPWKAARSFGLISAPKPKRQSASFN